MILPETTIYTAGRRQLFGFITNVSNERIRSLFVSRENKKTYLRYYIIILIDYKERKAHFVWYHWV